ncbi:hypothetical protein, partial [Nocardiopsis sp. MG754419]|uniref:hypothetical protein n=1 Tax=Nocardiopsis sp. MG754419 TaxID=2259865 RepID=UPI001BA56F83
PSPAPGAPPVADGGAELAAVGEDPETPVPQGSTVVMEQDTEAPAPDRRPTGRASWIVVGAGVLVLALGVAAWRLSDPDRAGFGPGFGFEYGTGAHGALEAPADADRATPWEIEEGTTPLTVAITL